MTETVSSADPNLILLEGFNAFQKHAQQIMEHTSRELLILSDELDMSLYGATEFIDTLSGFVRSDRRAKAKILVKKTKLIIERNHPMIRLAKRLTSKIDIRELTLEPQNATLAYLMADRDKLLYKHDDAEYAGFANYKAAPECNRISEEFIYLWEHHSKSPADLRQLFI